jgi:hypothetical protein
MEPKTPKKTTKKAVEPLKFSEGYTSVTDMVRGTLGAAAAEEFDNYANARQLMNCLTVLRCSKGVSQAELASRMECGQPKVSKMEASADAELNFGDIINYATSLKMGVHVAFSPHRGNAVNHIRFHVNCIKREIDALVKLSGQDRQIGGAVEAFALDTVGRLITLIEASLEELPHRAQTNAPVSVEAEDDRGQPITLDTSKRTPKRVSKKAGV